MWRSRSAGRRGVTTFCRRSWRSWSIVRSIASSLPEGRQQSWRQRQQPRVSRSSFIANNPVELGIVASLDRPGGNLTGIGLLVADLVAKQLEFLKEVVPQASALAYLQNPKSPTAALNEGSVRDAARTLGIKLDVIHASAEVELDKAFEAVAALGSRGIIVEGDPYFDSRRERIIALATHHSVVGCYPWREYAALGGLMSYGSNLPDAYRQSAHYVGRILKGAKPADLPVERPDKFELV